MPNTVLFGSLVRRLVMSCPNAVLYRIHAEQASPAGKGSSARPTLSYVRCRGLQPGAAKTAHLAAEVLIWTA
jgi:hypothetical protein